MCPPCSTMFVCSSFRWKRRIRSIQLLSIVAIISFSESPFSLVSLLHQSSLFTHRSPLSLLPCFPASRSDSSAGLPLSHHLVSPRHSKELTSSISKSSNPPPNLPDLQYPLNRDRINAPTTTITSKPRTKISTSGTIFHGRGSAYFKD